MYCNSEKEYKKEIGATQRVECDIIVLKQFSRL